MALFRGKEDKRTSGEMSAELVDFEVVDAMPENEGALTEDRDVSRMREATSPQDFRMTGVIDRALTDDFATLHALAQGIDSDILGEYIESYFRMTASEGGRGRTDMVSVGRQTPPTGEDVRRRSIFRWGGKEGA